MPCVPGSANCIVANRSDTYGVLSGYGAAPGYDLVTGLGSVDALNLVTAAGWSTNSSSVTPGGASSLVNAASYAASVAPGSVATAFGDFSLNEPVSALGVPLPPILDGLSLKFSPGFSAPLFYASATQANIQIPWELAGSESSSLTAILGGQASSQFTITLAAFAPAIFGMNGQGTGQGAILDARYELVDASNPAAAGDVVQIYSTGLGAVTNQPASGHASPFSPLAFTLVNPMVTIGGLPARVLFSGLTPGAVGLYQVNAEVPAGAPAGPAAPVALSIGGKASNTVTIAIH